MFVYADNAATTSVCSAAIDAINKALREVYGNPSSIHQAGQRARKILIDSRKLIASKINAKPNEIIFTSGGTESDNQAVLTGMAVGRAAEKNEIITSRIEHPAILRPVEKLKSMDFKILYAENDKNGVISPESVRKLISSKTAFCSCMLANNEIGTIEPIKEIAAVCHDNNILFHTDAVQAMGHIKIDVNNLGVDMLSASGHKFHGPKGVGFLYIKNGVIPSKLVLGGGQERNYRAGTENIPGICGMAAALEDSYFNFDEKYKKLFKSKKYLADRLLAIPQSYINGSLENSLPGTLNVTFKGIDSEGLLLMLDDMGICASAGSACSSGSLQPSRVLEAISLPKDDLKSAIRFSLSEDVKKEELDYIADTTSICVEKLRKQSHVLQ